MFMMMCDVPRCGCGEARAVVAKEDGWMVELAVFFWREVGTQPAD